VPRTSERPIVLATSQIGVKKMPDRLDLLIELLFDATAREDEKHDATMDIGEFNDDRAINALLQIAIDPNENETILDACGESIAQIWTKRNQFNVEAYKSFRPCAQEAIKMYIKYNKPEWLIYV
jgi:hypothetical protein